MKFTRVKSILIALTCLSFIVCMLLSIAVVSDINLITGQEPIARLSEIPVHLPLQQGSESDGYLTHSWRVSLKAKHTRWNSSGIMDVLQNRNTVATGVNTSTGEDGLPNYDVHIFYYPWYGNPGLDGVYLHWNHKILPHWKPEISARYPVGQRYQPPDDVGSNFYPRLGPYSSRDPSVIADHMRQIRLSGAGYL